MPASISVIVPVYNGAALLDRAIQSVLRQTYSDWELIAVDDGSSDDSHTLLKAWTAKDPRIHVICREENRGVSAARNIAIQNACGRFITYLDQDDEYHSDYLANVARLGENADVLMFCYDFVYEDGPAENRPPSWDPGQVRHLFFAQHIATPIGVAHRREFWEKTGGFNEAWCEEDSDFWRRMARAGAKFIFVPLKSGLYHVRRETASRVPHITARQKQMFLANWRAGRPLYWDGNAGSEISDLKSEDGPHPGPLLAEDATTVHCPPSAVHAPHRRPNRKIAFVAPHCLLDFNSDAAKATLAGLHLLAKAGFECLALCATHFQVTEEIWIQDFLTRQGLSFEVFDAKIGAYDGRMIFATQGAVSLSLFNTFSTRGIWRDDAEAAAFLTACKIFLGKQRPDVVWTYGADQVSLAVQHLARRLDVPVLVALHHMSPVDPAAFKLADYVIVPTESCRQHYWSTMGLASLTLPPVVDDENTDLASVYREFFAGITHQPGPPLVPKDVVIG